MHLLLISAELGFAWDGDERGWVRPSPPPLRMMRGPIQHFFSSTLDAWRFRVFAQLAERKEFFGVSSLKTLRALYNYYPLPSWGKR